MPLMTTKPMFDLAYDGGFAIGAFNVNNMELAQSIVDACVKENSPCILQISKGARKYANIRYLKAIIDAAVAENPTVPIAVHCDHGDTVDLIQTCVNDGYTSVMIDGSHHPFEENIRLTAEAVKLAHANGVVVEAELGMLGGIEEDVVGMDAHEYEKNVEKFLTDGVNPQDFARIKTQIRADEIYARDDAQGLARTYGAALAVGLSVGDVHSWPDVLQAVTEDEVMAAARMVFDRKKAVTGWLTREEGAAE